MAQSWQSPSIEPRFAAANLEHQDVIDAFVRAQQRRSWPAFHPRTWTCLSWSRRRAGTRIGRSRASLPPVFGIAQPCRHSLPADLKEQWRAHLRPSLTRCRVLRSP